MCVDYRKLDMVTRNGANSLPRIQHLFQSLIGCNYFNTLDLASSCQQMEGHSENRVCLTLYSEKDFGGNLSKRIQVFETL